MCNNRVMCNNARFAHFSLDTGRKFKVHKDAQFTPSVQRLLLQI